MLLHAGFLFYPTGKMDTSPNVTERFGSSPAAILEHRNISI